MSVVNTSSVESLIIIPTYNERENVGEVIQRVLSVVEDLDVLVIDDNSPDETGDFVKELQVAEPRLHLIQREGKLGLGTAYIEGFRFALKHNYRFIFEMDADLSHNPNEIPNFLQAIKDADLVIGSRYIDGVNVVNWPLRRLLLSYGASIYTRIITRLRLRDTTSGFKCFRREVLESINLNEIKSGGYAFQIEMNWIVWMDGFRIKEIPIVFVDRTVGKSKMSRSIVREAVLIVWKLGIAGLFRQPKKRESVDEPVHS